MPQSGSAQAPAPSAAPRTGRIAWIDCLKGASIVFVVLYHAPLIAGESVWLVDMINAKMEPIRMPAFFLASGMLTFFALRSGWGRYARRRIAPLVYTFVIWTLVTFAASYVLPWPEPISTDRLPEMFVQPKSVLWFVAELALFVLAVRIFARYPAATLALAAVYAAIFWEQRTGNRLEYGLRYFVFFAAGAYCQPLLRRLIEARPVALVLGTAAVWLAITFSPLPDRSLAMAVIGVAGFAAAIVLASRTPLCEALAFVGTRSVSIYLLHWLVMANVVALLPVTVSGLGGLLALTAAGVAVPLMARPWLPDALFAPPTPAFRAAT